MDDEPLRRRPRRRAVRQAGTVGGDEDALRSSFVAPQEPEQPRRVTQPVPRAPSGLRAPDDQDVGWGTPADDSNDERLTRERPPHW